MKTERPLPRFDCAAAPCVSACPAGQDIPRYLDAVARGDFPLAWEIITATNPFPNVQGMACNQRCRERCTRINYDSPLLIRDIKRTVALRMADGPTPSPVPATGRRVAVIGAGPSGLSCARFLALGGVEVHLYEGKDVLGGMAADAIPTYRLSDESLRRDVEAVLALGVILHRHTAADAELFRRLLKENDAVYVAVGAQESLPLGIPGEGAAGVVDHLSFLSAVRRGLPTGLGPQVAVIGGGNAAMDCARAAKRLVGADGCVTLVYRRSRREIGEGRAPPGRRPGNTSPSTARRATDGPSQRHAPQPEPALKAAKRPRGLRTRIDTYAPFPARNRHSLQRTARGSPEAPKAEKRRKKNVRPVRKPSSAGPDELLLKCVTEGSISCRRGCRGNVRQAAPAPFQWLSLIHI